MVFVKGRKKTTEDLRIMKKAREEKYGFGVCVGCGEQFPKYNSFSKTCGDDVCLKISQKKRKERLKTDNPVRYKATSMAGSIRLGDGKISILEEMIKSAILNGCEYCGEKITIENASLDHKTPRKFAKVYCRKTKKRIYSDEELKHLDRKENLHIVCRNCNQLKNDMNDDQFRRFLVFLNNDEEMKKLIVRRLRRGLLFYGR